jgi:hypothetical protein
LSGLTNVFRLAGVIFALSVARASAQGGPPMLTDDPGTPGNGHSETNIAITIDRASHETLLSAPAIDLNYGVGEHIQLNLETSLNILKRDDRGAVGGPGSASVAVKWRFCDEDRNGLAASIYPRLEWNTFQASVRRGLADDGTRLLLPVQVAHKIKTIDVDVELGALASTVGRSEWVYGIVGGAPITSTTYVMAEVHGSCRSTFERDILTFNFGLRQKLNASLNLIASVGTDVRGPSNERARLIGYFGAQLEY